MAAPSVTGGLTDIYATGTALGKVNSIKADSVLGGTSGISTINGAFKIQGVSYGDNGPTAAMRTLGSAIDFTASDTYWGGAFYESGNLQTLSTTTGFAVVFLSPDGDGTYSEAVYNFVGDHTGHLGNPPGNLVDPVLINPNDSTNAWVYDAGFDPSNVTHIALGCEQGAGYATIGVNCATTTNEFWTVTPSVLNGGEVADRASFNDLCDYFDTNYAGRNWHTSPTDAMHYVGFPYKITADDYLTTNQVIQYQNPANMSDVEGICQYHVSDNDLGHWVDCPATKKCIDRNVLFLGEQPFRFWQKGASQTDVAVDACTIIGAGDVQIDDGRKVDGSTFAECGPVTGSAPTITNTAISNPSGTYGVDITDCGNMSGITINNATTGVLFDFPGSASVTMPDWTFNGCTTDVEYTGTGTLTITATNGTQITTTNASGGGTISVQGALIQQGLQFSNLQSDSLVVVYEAGTANVIAITTSSGTTFDWIETYSADQDVDYVIIKEGFIPILVSGISLSDSVVPVQVQQVADRAYAASTGLIYGSNVVIDTVAKTIAVSANTTVQNLYNALNEFWRAQTSLRNVKFPVITNGPNSFTFIDGWELTSGSFPYLSRDGVRYLNLAGSRTAAWAAILTAGETTGLTAEYQQVDGAAPTDAMNSGPVDQLIQVYGDASHGNFDYSNYLVIKYQANGYDEAVVDVVDQYGQLEDQLYVVAIAPTQMAGFTGGDPGITGVSITDHGASPVSWNGKSWSITITDTGGNTGEAIHRWLNYNKSLDATFQGFEPFNLFDMVVDAGSTYETRRGDLIGSAGASIKGVRVVDGSGDPHPFFTRFQADDGSYYTPPQAITLSAPNLTAGRVQLYNVTTDTEIENTTISSGYTAGWVDGGDFTAGDTIRLRWVAIDKMEIEAFSAAPASGSVSFVNPPVSDDVYVNNGVNGATVTGFAADYANDEIDLTVAANFNGVDMYAWWKHNLTTSQGIADFFGGCTAIDQANYRFNSSVVSIYLDNTTATNVIQLDNVRIFRSDEAYPVKNPTTGSGGIDVNWRDKVFLSVTGSGALTTAQQAQLTAAASSKYTQAELHTDLDAYANKDDWKGTAGGGGGLDEAGMHTALDNYTNKDDWKGTGGLDESGLHTALDNYPNKADWDTALTELQIHNWLDSYDNKFSWQAAPVNIKKILKRL